MPRGKYVNYKGRTRHFTTAEELAQASDESSEEETNSGESGNEEKEEDMRDAKKGVASLIEIQNPNRVVQKAMHQSDTLNIDDKPVKPELSRREREEIEKQKARLHYEKLHAAGKTSEAKADLARLAIIRQQRAEDAAKREAKKKIISHKD